MTRRTILRGFGAALALPYLEAANRAGSKPPVRMAFCYVPNGIIPDQWTPDAEGTAFSMKHIMQPLEPFREKLLVLTGLTHNGGRALGDGPGDHARAAASFLTGIHPRKTAGADIKAGISVDQVAAQRMGHLTRFASLELGLEDGRLVGNCDSGYSCAYSNNLSWRAEATPMPPEMNPRLVFEKLFGSGDEVEDAEARGRRLRQQKSVLDGLLAETKALQAKLGATDRRKMDEYLTSIREIEKQIEANDRAGVQMAPPMGKPDGIPLEYSEHARLMFDLMTVAFQMDATRVQTLMMAREGSTRAYREIGVSDAHHPLTHHRGEQEMIAKVVKINRYHVEQFAYFLNKLQSTPDGDGTLLDHSMVVYGSGLADGNRHTHHDLPVVLAGRGNGTLKPGRHVRYVKDTPMANLYLSMLDRLGVETESLGDSNGKLAMLSEI